MFRPIAAFLLVAALPAYAATPPSAEPAQGEKATDDKDKVVCKRFAVTGSLVGSHRECKPKREWERARAENQAVNAANSCANSGQAGGC